MPIRALFETNLFGLAAMVRAVLPGMRAQGSGVIINMSSASGVVAFPGLGYYSASKFAVEGLTERRTSRPGRLGPPFPYPEHGLVFAHAA